MKGRKPTPCTMPKTKSLTRKRLTTHRVRLKVTYTFLIARFYLVTCIVFAKTPECDERQDGALTSLDQYGG